MNQPGSGPWARFRAFRSARPFWAGLFTIVAGGEILLFPLTPIASLIQLGVGAISGVLFGVGLVALGLFMWFSPPNRTLAGVFTILISLASFITSNLGGLVIGMVLGLIGGGLCLAWTPKAGPPKGSKRRRRGRVDPRVDPGADPAEVTQDLSAEPAPVRPSTATPRPGRRRPLRPDELPDDIAEEPPPRRPRPRPSADFRRLLGGRRLAVLLAGALLGTVLAEPGVAAAQDCFLGVVCSDPEPSDQADPAPTGKAKAEEGGDDGEVPPVTPNPSPGGPLGELSDSLNGALGALPLPDLPALTPATIPLLAELLPQLITPVLPAVAAQDGIVVSGRINNTTMDTLTVTNFRFVGVVTHQVAGGGTQRALRVIVDSTDIGNLGAILPGPEASKLVNQKAGAAHATSGQLILDFTRLKITVFGVLPLEFSFAFPPPPLITIPVLSGTDVDIDFVQLDTSATIPGVVVGIGPPSDGPPTTDTAKSADPKTSLTSLVGLASALKLPGLLTPYGLTDAQSKQAVAAYDKDPAAPATEQGTDAAPAPASRRAAEGAQDDDDQQTAEPGPGA